MAVGQKSRIKINPQHTVTIELSSHAVAEIAGYVLAQNPELVERNRDKEGCIPGEVIDRIVREHVMAHVTQLSCQATEPSDAHAHISTQSKSHINPRPRNDRVTNAYVGNRADFEAVPIPISTALATKINEVLALPEPEREKRYAGALHLHSYNHELYRWFATITKTVIGRPIRRYFVDLPGAVTWLESVRDRWERKTLLYNIPLGGVSRLEFRMPWETQADRPTRADRARAKLSAKRAESNAKVADTNRVKKGFHSVDPRRQSHQVRARATTTQVLAGAFIPMPGNNVGTAATAGGTAASS